MNNKVDVRFQNGSTLLDEEVLNQIIDAINEIKEELDTKADRAEMIVELDKKQETLVDNVNIKRVNGKSLLGEGNILAE